MRDRWVLVFVVACVLQLPLYLILGRGPLTYDVSMKTAETILYHPNLKNPSDYQRAHTALDDSQKALSEIGVTDSRQARLDLARAFLAWNEGKIGEADGLFRKAVGEYETTHGPDSFHACAKNLSYAEFLMLIGRHDDALFRFERGFQGVEDFLGPRDPFAVHMVFRYVSLLVYRGRRAEAVRLGCDYLPALVENAGQQELQYLMQVGSVLDELSRNPLGEGRGIPPAPGGHGWRFALEQANREAKQRMPDSQENG